MNKNMIFWWTLPLIYWNLVSTSVYAFIAPKYPTFALPRFRRHLQNKMIETNNKPHIIIAGPPSVGKGTLCSAVRTKLGLVHISCGELFRDLIASNNDIGRKVSSYVTSGNLVPDHIVLDMLRDRLKSKDCDNAGWVLDGFPRSKTQALSLLRMGYNISDVIVLDAPESVIVERGMGRCIDPNTGIVYHRTHDPPPPEILERVVTRADDTKEMLSKRYEQYQNSIANILEVFGDKVHIIDASRELQTYIQDIDRLLDKYVKKGET